MLFVFFTFGCTETSKEIDFDEVTVEQENIDADSDGYLSFEDCDDSDRSVNPGAMEICDGRDNDCNGQVDEGVLNTYFLDADQDGHGTPEISTEGCETVDGYVANGNDCDDEDPERYPGSLEICDEIDNDCNGLVDENLGNLWYLDTDQDGYGDPQSALQSCDQLAGYIQQAGDCNDDDATINPEVAEECDGIDNNCNGEIDEFGSITWYQDTDNDGYGNINQPLQSCTQPSGYVSNTLDCNDNSADVNPAAVEVCDFLDNDCNGTSDDNASDAQLWYIDNDQDGFGSTSTTLTACTQPLGYANNADDCDDTRFESSPVALEYCNGADDDCDGTTDEPDAVDASIYFIDSDNDGYGDPYSPVLSCNVISGYANNNQDCDDNNGSVYPYATEYCNNLDDNCNTIVDEAAADQLIFYQDTDNDGYGSSIFELACSPSPGYTSQDADCDDNDPNINPGAIETCNEIDDDCNGSADDNLATSLWYADNDQDGYGDPNDIEYNCLQPTGYIAQGQDCDDTDATINPDGTEICNGLDDDCDGTSDAGSLGLDTLCAADSCLDILTAEPNSVDGSFYINFDSGIAQTQCDMGSFGGGWTQVFADNMSPPDSGWTLQTTTTCGIWGEILGGYNVISGGEFSNTITTKGIAHTETWVEMDYMACNKLLESKI